METISHFLTSPDFGFLLKLFSGLATAGFGILGIGATTRNKAGHLTRSGKIALTGILVSAAIGSISSIYDFITAQKSAAAEHRRAEQLLTSVRRGIYPFRDLRFGITLRFALDIAGSRDYIEGLRKLPEVKSEHIRPDQREPFDSGYEPEPEGFDIPFGSKLFPAKSSMLYAMLNNLIIDLSLFREVPAELRDKKQPPYAAAGGFRVFLPLAPSSKLIYDYERDMLYFVTDGISVAKARPYSLVDFVPGLVAAAPLLGSISACNSRKLSENYCDQRIEAPFENGAILESIHIDLPYPKKIPHYENGVPLHDQRIALSGIPIPC